MGFLFPLLYILFFTYSLMSLMKTKFERVLPFTFIISALVLFLSQFLFKTFYIGFFACILFSFLFPIKILIKKESLKTIKEKYITKGVFAFLLLYFIVFLFDFNRFFTHWDELSHWGKMVKEMFRLNSFYSVETSNLLVHKDYPPIMSLMELFYTILSGKFREVYLIRCMHLFEGSLILSCLQYEKCTYKEAIFKTSISLILMYLLTLLFDTAIVINSIYTDYVLAFFVAYLLFHIFKNHEFNWIEIILFSISCIFLLLLKQVAIAFYLMILFLFIIHAVMNKYKWNYKRIFITCLLLIILPLASLFLWNNYINHLGIQRQFNISDMNPSTFLSIAKGSSGEDWQRETIKNYSYAIFNKSILNSKVQMSYIQFGIVLLFTIYILYKKLKEKIKIKNMIALSITLFLGFFGYMLLMLLLYVYSFGEYEGPILASFDRYMSTYILICFYTLFFIYIKFNNLKTKEQLRYIVIIFAIAIVIEPMAYAKIRPDLILLNNHDFDEYKQASEFIDQYAKELDKVYIIDQVEKNGAMYFINYFSNKVSTNRADYTLLTNGGSTEELFYSAYYDNMKKYKYLYTFTIDEEFMNAYHFLTNDSIQEKTLYEIVIENNQLILKRIESL